MSERSAAASGRHVLGRAVAGAAAGDGELTVEGGTGGSSRIWWGR